MLGAAFCWLLLLAGQFPRPGGAGAGAGMGAGSQTRDLSWISGHVRTQGGEPLPQATVSVQTLPDASRADRRDRVTQWPGADVRVRPDGTFRVAVPGQTTFRVCAVVPGKAQQCRNVDVSANDLEVVEFVF